MQLLPILLVAAVLAADEGFTLQAMLPELGVAWLVAASIGPYALLLLAHWTLTTRCRRRLSRGEVPGPIVAAERIANAIRLLVLAQHGLALLLFGWLDLVRGVTGNLVLLDELLVLILPLATIYATWWIYYPVEQRVREALLVRRLDEGRPLHAMPGPGRYIWRQGQVQIMLLLVPILMIVGLSETIAFIVLSAMSGESAQLIAQGGTVAAGVLVFVFAPMVARWLLATEPMAPGSMRDDLLAICDRHRVRVREILVWRTDGMMINAAVMGLIAPLRFVLITDALLECMTREELRAVMAHEVGHVRRHHMPWMVICLIAIIAAAEFVVVAPLELLLPDTYTTSTVAPGWLELVVASAIILLAIFAFGWVSRRFERQADTFAVQHLSEDPNGTTGESMVTEQAVGAMRAALLTICRLNAIEPRRKSWRHGTIAWRIGYQQSLVGQPIRALPIDRVVRRLKVLAALGLAGAIGYESYLQATYDDGAARDSEVANEPARVEPASP